MSNANGAATQQETAVTALGGFVTEFRRQIVAAIVAGLVAGFLAALGVIWAYLQTFIGSFGLVPKDAVIAFAGECPARGWETYRDGIGKFIVGAGAGGKLATGGLTVDLTAKALLDQGGEEAHRLLLNEMPSHNHRVSSIYDRDIHDGFGGSSEDRGLNPEFNPNFPTKPGWSITVHDKFLEKTGGNADGSTSAHNNMPPFIALTWCKRTS